MRQTADSVSRVLLASLIGTTIESFDSYAFATAAVLVFPKLFFRADDVAAEMLQSLVTFVLAGLFFATLGRGALRLLTDIARSSSHDLAPATPVASLRVPGLTMKMPPPARRHPNICRAGLLPLFAVITCWLLGSTAGASEDSTPSVTVHYWDLDLSRRDDRETLRLRLRHAAAKVCRDLYFADPGLSLEFAGCVDRSTNKALAVVNSRPRTAQVPGP